jgi:hypothetical protein
MSVQFDTQTGFRMIEPLSIVSRNQLTATSAVDAEKLNPRDFGTFLKNVQLIWLFHDRLLLALKQGEWPATPGGFVMQGREHPKQ